jgi:hypothetical protein
MREGYRVPFPENPENHVAKESGQVTIEGIPANLESEYITEHEEGIPNNEREKARNTLER